MTKLLKPSPKITNGTIEPAQQSHKELAKSTVPQPIRAIAQKVKDIGYEASDARAPTLLVQSDQGVRVGGFS